MLPVATLAGGWCKAAPDVCAGPSGAPLAYENRAKLVAATAVAARVLVQHKPILVVGSVIPKSLHWPSGAGPGVVSGSVRGCVRVKGASSKVLVQGRGAARLGSRTLHNGIPANAPNGKITEIGQTRVMVAP